MNIDNDYDNDGNNIVPCPICLDVYCPSKENGKCPEEDMFALEGEIRMLLDEYKATDDNSRIANVLETVEKIHHHQLQKAREEERERILSWCKRNRETINCGNETWEVVDYEELMKASYTLDHSELDQDKV